MYRARRLLASVALGVGLLVSLSLDDALAQGAKSVHLTPSRDSGVSGTATLTEVEGGVRVQLNMRGLPEAGVKHINHIHGGGTCADDRAGRTAPVTIPLNPVKAKEAGTGSAATIVEGVALAELFGKEKDRFILLHAKTEQGQGVPPGISCADLIPRSGDDGFDSLPASGGTHPAFLFALVAALIWGAVAWSLALLRGLT